MPRERRHVHITQYHVKQKPFQCFDIQSSYAISVTCMPNIERPTSCSVRLARDRDGVISLEVNASFCGDE